MSADRPVALLTRIWPTRERPSVGTFVRERAMGVAGLRVVKPRVPTPFIYPQLLFDALRLGPIRGVEAHMLLPTGLVGLIVARRRGVPLVVYSHGGDVRDWRRMRAPSRWLARQVAERADRLLTNSEDTAAHLRELGGRPEVIAPGADLTRFTAVTAAGGAPRPLPRRPEPAQGLRGGA